MAILVAIIVIGAFFYVNDHVRYWRRLDDFKSLYLQLKLAIADVLDAYDRIGERYLSLMDEETEERILKLHSTVEQIESIIRYQSWLKGIK